MTKIMQNLVFLMEPSNNPLEVSFKGGNMCLNRFSIDENGAFELSGVYNLEKTSKNIRLHDGFEVERKSKGKENLTLKK